MRGFFVLLWRRFLAVVDVEALIECPAHQLPRHESLALYQVLAISDCKYIIAEGQVRDKYRYKRRCAYNPILAYRQQSLLENFGAKERRLNERPTTNQ